MLEARARSLFGQPPAVRFRLRALTMGRAPPLPRSQPGSFAPHTLPGTSSMSNFGKFDFRVSISHSIILTRTASSNRGVGSPHGLSPMKDAISRVSAAECLEALLELQRSLQPLPISAPFLNSLEAKLDSIPHACWVGGYLLPIDTRTTYVTRTACVYPWEPLCVAEVYSRDINS